MCPGPSSLPHRCRGPSATEVRPGARSGHGPPKADRSDRAAASHPRAHSTRSGCHRRRGRWSTSNQPPTPRAAAVARTKTVIANHCPESTAPWCGFRGEDRPSPAGRGQPSWAGGRAAQRPGIVPPGSATTTPDRRGAPRRGRGVARPLSHHRARRRARPSTTTRQPVRNRAGDRPLVTPACASSRGGRAPAPAAPRSAVPAGAPSPGRSLRHRRGTRRPRAAPAPPG